MSGRASGPFDVKLTPQDDKLDPTLGRMTIEKTLHGDLEATSKGQMLTASTDVKGSAGYVAVERVTGTLKTPAGPRTGSFALQHFATLTRGAPELNIIVVPDSGTGQLVGLTGKMNIEIARCGTYQEWRSASSATAIRPTNRCSRLPAFACARVGTA